MATETVSAPEGADTNPLTRIELAGDGLDEIGQLSVVLRDLIAKYDETGNVSVFTRGILARIEELSHVARHLIGVGSDEFSEAELARVVTCVRPVDLGAALPIGRAGAAA